jgi:hypothetical protein
VDDFTIAALYEAGKAKVDPATALSTMNRVLPVYEKAIKSELESIYEQNLPKNQRNKAVAAASEKVLQDLIRDERLKQVAAGLLRAKVSPRNRTTYIYNRMVSQAAGVKGMDKATAEDLVQSILYPGVDAPNRDTPMLKGVSLPVLVGQKPGKFLESKGDTVSNLAKSMGARTKGVAKNWLRLTRAKSDLLDSGPDLAEVQEFVSAGDAALVLNDPVYLGEIIQRANLSSSPAQKAMMDLLINAAADVDYWDSSGRSLFKPGKGEANKDTLTLSESAFVKWLKEADVNIVGPIQSARRYGQLWSKVSPKLIAAAKELALEKTPRSKRVGPGSNISDPGIRSLYREDVRGRRAALERRALIRLASSLPVGSEERRAILAGCEKLPEGPMRDNCEKKKEEGASDKKARENPRKKIERHMYVIHKAGDRYVVTHGDPRKPGVKIRMRSQHKSDVTEYLEEIGVSNDHIFDMTREFGIPDTYSDFYMRMKRLASQRDLSNTSNALVRLAASLPKGSSERRAILATIKAANSMNAGKVPLDKAKEYAERVFGKPADEVLPDFDKNYRMLQKKVKQSPAIPRIQMPVIEPSDIDEFNAALNSGRVDVFAPYTKGKLVGPDEIEESEDGKWVELGIKDGDASDDVVKAKMTALPVGKLKPTQNQIWLEKTFGNIAKFGAPKSGSPVLTKTIIVSSDGYILDGHHRFSQAIMADPTLKIKALVVPMKIKQLLEIGRHYGEAIGNKAKTAKKFEKKTAGKGKVPDALKKHQFTSEDNPNPKGNDKDGDGKSGEKKPFESKKSARVKSKSESMRMMGDLRKKHGNGTKAYYQAVIDEVKAGVIAPSAVVGGGYKNGKKVAIEWLEGQMKGKKASLRRTARRHFAGRRYDYGEVIDFLTDDKSTPELERMWKKWSAMVEDLHERWIEGWAEANAPELLDESIDYAELAWKAFGSVTGMGIGLWEGDFLGDEHDEAFEKVVERDSKVSRFGRDLNDEITMVQEGEDDESMRMASRRKSASGNHHVAPNGDIFVDTAFLNATKRIPGVTLGHMGFGEFYADTPKGRVDFDRMRGKDFPGQSGRSHKLYGEGNAADWLLDQMTRKGQSVESGSRMAADQKGKKAALVRLAAALPVGSDERKTILRMAAGDLKSALRPGLDRFTKSVMRLVAKELKGRGKHITDVKLEDSNTVRFKIRGKDGRISIFLVLSGSKPGIEVQYEGKKNWMKNKIPVNMDREASDFFSQAFYAIPSRLLD